MCYMNKLKERLFLNAAEENKKNILSFIQNHTGILLDLGCDDGSWTYQLMKIANSTFNIGVDIADVQLIKAKNVLMPVKSNLNESLPFKSGTIDVVHTNQVIEHVLNVDNFCEEIYRVLKPGGYVIISTENLSSWHNLFALFIGKQAFSQHISARVNIGNSMSLHYGESIRDLWVHIRVFTYYGLKELFEYYKFRDIRILGAGYYPFLGRISKWMSQIDPIHTHFITLKAFK